MYCLYKRTLTLIDINDACDLSRLRPLYVPQYPCYSIDKAIGQVSSTLHPFAPQESARRFSSILSSRVSRLRLTRQKQDMSVLKIKSRMTRVQDL